MRIAVNFIWLLAAGLLLAGCVNKEPDQRAAFMAWLQASVVEAPGAAVPALDDAQRDAFGDYVEHYQVLADFDAVAATVVERLGRALEHQELHTLAQLRARQDALLADRQALSEARASLRRALERAGTERAGLEQPADLQAVYAQAYGRAVTGSAARLEPLLAVAAAALDDAVRAAEYVVRHRGQIVIDAESASVRDPSVQQELNRLLDALNGHAEAVGQAQRSLRALAPA
ncbi:DUF3053 domain-containing protein [Bordetella petrii]|uniref:Lipoprotein n=1 Tax=Bordetella petrii (strain ATCC BAA-461 / DSM 12804 / CCUG 43448 / CIP 107267 / Se-1111R) TaxID=340100 RepID=A9IQI4_BORPD|nr:DUF3053 domain-containing protein [Bordetella petrii]CAP43061.1 putative lipoprotein [Bordetella petrii]